MIKTNVVEITDPRLEIRGRGARVFTSLEGENPGRSIKDHAVVGELTAWLETGILQPGDAVAEISAGSTALSLAYWTRRLGLQCVLFVPDSAPTESLERMRNWGAELHSVDAADAAKAYADFDDYCRSRRLRKFNQMADKGKRRHYGRLASAIQSDVDLDLLIGAVGTGHSLLGVGQALGEQILIFSAEPVEGQKVVGIRNLAHERFGKDDPCSVADIPRRIEVDSRHYFPDSQLETSAGLIEVPLSFQLVLGALAKTVSDRENLEIFALSASSRRVKM